MKYELWIQYEITGLPVKGTGGTPVAAGVGLSWQPGEIAAIKTTCGLKEPVVRYVWVTVVSREMRVPLLSPKSQLKVMSDPLRYWLGSCKLMLKDTALFWIKLWSPWLMSPTWDNITVKGIWSREEEEISLGSCGNMFSKWQHWFTLYSSVQGSGLMAWILTTV